MPYHWTDVLIICHSYQLAQCEISFNTCPAVILFNFTSFNQNNFFTISKFCNTSLLPVVDIHCEGCNLKFTKTLHTAQHATCLNTKNLTRPCHG